MMRAAVYWAPEVHDPLHALGSAWLGRDAETGAACAQPEGLAEITADARGYGLHATLKPPFHLAQPWPALRDAVAELAARTAAFPLPPLAVRDMKGFLALCEVTPCPALHALADACVAQLDAHRVPPSEHELERRRHAKLTPRQEANLQAWGYPYVLEDWRFHITLTRRLDDAERAAIMPRAIAHFAAVAGLPRIVTEICLFTQAGPGAPFLVAERFALKGLA